MVSANPAGSDCAYVSVYISIQYIYVYMLAPPKKVFFYLVASNFHLKHAAFLQKNKWLLLKEMLLTGYNLPWRQDIPLNKKQYPCKKTTMCGKMQYIL